MTKIFTGISLSCLLLLSAGNVMAQTRPDQPDLDTSRAPEKFIPNGKLWGYAFGDYAYKGGNDEAGRGGSNQYTKVPVNSNEFQFRRIYLGYTYNISKKFVADFLLAAEDDFASGVLGQGNGDILLNNKFSPYVKLADLRWKNLWKGTDLVIGQSPTPTFAMGSPLAENARNTQTSEEVWGYRSIERTITDIRRTSSYDMGVSLQGWLDNKGNFGYDLMAANGTGDKPEGDRFKWFYGDVYAKFFKKRLILDFYQDYTKINWTNTWHHDRNMSKLFLAWNDKKFTIGVEAFQNTLMGDVAAIGTDKKTYYRTTKAMGISAFARANIYKDVLGVFARFDSYNPSMDLGEVTDNKSFVSYSALTSQYEPTTKEQFVTFGFDFKPIKNVHIMPNIWINTYNSDLTPSSTYTSAYNPNISGIKGTDAVYRITFYYIYGK